MSDNVLVAAEVISAFVANNSVPASELPDLIRAVVGTLDKLGQPQIEQARIEKPIPAVPVRRSVHHDFLISLEDGKRYQTLRRHLSGLGMSPADYRTKWGLAADYPMTAPGYSERRSALAKSLGLGRKPPEPVATAQKPKRSRAKTKTAAVAEAPSEAAESAQEAA